MKSTINTLLTTFLFLLLGCGVAFGGGPSEQISLASIGIGDSPPIAVGSAQKDAELVGKFADFKKFTVEKVKQLNRNLRFARSRMEITKQPDGSYRARDHPIDDSSLGVKVTRSQSRSIPFVGILSYQEQVYEAISRSPDSFAADGFSLVQIIPNRHIFSYKKGIWD